MSAKAECRIGRVGSRPLIEIYRFTNTPLRRGTRALGLRPPLICPPAMAGYLFGGIEVWYRPAYNSRKTSGSSIAHRTPAMAARAELAAM
jgi:hypothetical protein